MLRNFFWFVFIISIFYQLSINAFQLSGKKLSTFVHNKKVGVLMSTDDDQPTTSQAIIGVSGIVANVVTDYSLYILKSTGCGLPPGPYGLLGAAEGVSYLGVVGLLVWSVSTKLKTGKGLPAGPSGLLGASEGLSFLTVLGGLIVAGLNLQQYGYLPGFLPDGNCYGGP